MRDELREPDAPPLPDESSSTSVTPCCRSSESMKTGTSCGAWAPPSHLKPPPVATPPPAEETKENGGVTNSPLRAVGRA